ncbi:PHD finger-like domain-containing protein 5A [Astathelohania contejeani]|uniref:PHD finger-like domain-containing protein 5A n=1 Tax=Astathelohania contejeani TaxID=164912 RepID=A0ABQ7HXM4_9MICR|nr:PHD finger-like domain-containing protein 5A [Thelohania contejeani]
MVNQKIKICNNLNLCKKGLVCEKCEGTCPMCGLFTSEKNDILICGICENNLNGRCILCCSTNANYAVYCCNECNLLKKNIMGCCVVINPEINIQNIYSKGKFS